MSTIDGTTDAPEQAAKFLEAHPRIEFLEAFLTDANGIARGKRVSAESLVRLYRSGLCLPASTLVLDVWGNEVEATGLVFATGDADHPCYPVPGSLRPLPWSDGRGAQVMLRMQTPSGEAFAADPRNILARVANRFAERGETPVVATELEFRLFDAEFDGAGIPHPPARLARAGGSQLYGLDEIDAMDVVFADIEEACRAQDLPADTIIAEQSDGQYELNLRHVADPVLAADHAVLLKRTIKAVARRHGLLASFMAKPFGHESGNGLHVHMSLLDAEGRNVFAGGEGPTPRLRHAVGGLAATMTDAMLVFAPHANSFRRFQVDSHAPLGPTWGFDNRTTAVRIPLSAPDALRVEHRVAGADANPYLVLAAVLAGIDHGLSGAVEPPPETEGSAFEQHARGLPETWEEALVAFRASGFIADYLGTEYRRLFSACKEQEQARFRREVPPVEYRTYLGTI